MKAVTIPNSNSTKHQARMQAVAGLNVGLQKDEYQWTGDTMLQRDGGWLIMVVRSASAGYMSTVGLIASEQD